MVLMFIITAIYNDHFSLSAQMIMVIFNNYCQHFPSQPSGRAQTQLLKVVENPLRTSLRPGHQGDNIIIIITITIMIMIMIIIITIAVIAVIIMTIITIMIVMTRNNPSPSPDKKEFRPLGFDSNSLKRNKRSVSAV